LLRTEICAELPIGVESSSSLLGKPLPTNPASLTAGSKSIPRFLSVTTVVVARES
jgi:hypothetical protein